MQKLFETLDWDHTKAIFAKALEHDHMIELSCYEMEVTYKGIDEAALPELWGYTHIETKDLDAGFKLAKYETKHRDSEIYQLQELFWNRLHRTSGQITISANEAGDHVMVKMQDSGNTNIPQNIGGFKFVNLKWDKKEGLILHYLRKEAAL